MEPASLLDTIGRLALAVLVIVVFLYIGWVLVKTPRTKPGKPKSGGQVSEPRNGPTADE